MQENDYVELIVDRDEYLKEGVSKGSTGWICHPQTVKGYWLVSFEDSDGLNEIACISIKEYDLVVIWTHPILTNSERVIMLSNKKYIKEGLKLGTDGIIVSYDKDKDSYLVDFNVKTSKEPVRVLVDEGYVIKYSELNEKSKKLYGLKD